MSDPFVVPADATTWVPRANGSSFPIQNLPLGLALLRDGSKSLVIRIGEWALNVKGLAREGLIPNRPCFGSDSAGALSVEDFRELRASTSSLLEESNGTLRDLGGSLAALLLPLDAITLQVPCIIPNFADFYSGIHHAFNVGKMFRPDMPPLLPNYRYLPVAYNGRASSVRVSGTPIARPKGQIKESGSADPVYRPTRELDFEVELGFYVARHDGPNREIKVEDAESHVLGFCLLNDWSARDIQRWEYQPLGPFLAKSFMTSVSPWIVSLDALEPFRIAGQTQTPAPPSHLASHSKGLFDIAIDVALKTPMMSKEQLIGRTNSRYLYWSCAQQLSHLTSNGLACEPGELCGSGTISGETPDSLGSLLEMSWRGTKPICLSETKEERTFLLDGDLVTMRARSLHDGYEIGFGEVSGCVQPAT